MEFHVYDTRLIRAYAHMLDLELSLERSQIASEKRALVEDTLSRMESDITRLTVDRDWKYVEYHFQHAWKLLEEQHAARMRAAAVRRKNDERRAKERQETLEWIAEKESFDKRLAQLEG